MKKIKDVYIAGPLFSWGEQWFNVRLKTELERAAAQSNLDLSFHLPQELEGDSESGIFEQNKSRIDASQCLVAILDGADIDSGTSWEIGYAYARGKRIIGVRTDFRYSGEQGRGNLMILESLSVPALNESRRADRPRFFTPPTRSEETEGDLIFELAHTLIQKIAEIETAQKNQGHREQE